MIVKTMGHYQISNQIGRELTFQKRAFIPPMGNSYMRIIVVTALLLCICGLARAQETALYFSSSPNDYIGGGQQRYYAPPQVTITGSANTTTSVVTFNITNFDASPSIWWYLNFSAANNNPLVPGTYLNAVRYPFQDFSQNGFSFYGEGRGCNTLTGEFTVLEAVYGAGGTIVRFAADFVQHCEGGTSALYGGIRFNSTVMASVPVLSFLLPSSTPAGTAFTLTLNGANFIDGSYVRWNGIGRPTTILSSTQMTAAIPIGDVAVPGAAEVTVFNPGQGGGISNPLSVTITNPVPRITSLSSTTAIVGAIGFTLTVTGTNFVSGAVVQWNGDSRITTFASSTQLTVAIPAADLVNVGNAQVTVFNPGPGGGVSNSISFAIVNPSPVITLLSPASAVAGGNTFSLTVNGSNFLNGSIVQWNRSNRTTTFGSNSQLIATIPASDIVALGYVQISVINPQPGGGSSNSLVFAIGNPIAVITSLSPPSTVAGSDAIALTVTGSNFLPGSVVRWNGSSRPTLFTGGQLVAAIPATDIVNAGTAQITVLNPGPGGGISNSLGFKIEPDAGNSYPYRYHFAQIAVGGGWQSTLTYVNYSPQSVVCQTSFLSDSGAPLLVPFGGAAAASHNDTIPAGGMLHRESTADIESRIAVGWAQAQCTGPIMASLLYRFYQGGVATAEASVNGVTPATKFVTFANDLTGIAYANPSAESAAVTFTALDSAGVKLGTASLTFSPGIHGAAFAAEILKLQSFSGSIQIVSTVPIVVLFVNYEAAPVFSSLPSGDLDSSTPLSSEK
jgi:hypothetical protein